MPRTLRERQRQHRRKYGITIQERAAIFKNQGGMCGLCHKPLPSLFGCALDHNHANQKVRALLHTQCNLLVGWIEREPNLVEKAQAYVANDGPACVPYIRGSVRQIQKRLGISNRQAYKIYKTPMLDPLVVAGIDSKLLDAVT